VGGLAALGAFVAAGFAVEARGIVDAVVVRPTVGAVGARVGFPAPVFVRAIGPESVCVL
jgi:hypothetical protein